MEQKISAPPNYLSGLAALWDAYSPLAVENGLPASDLPAPQGSLPSVQQLQGQLLLQLSVHIPAADQSLRFRLCFRIIF